MRVGIIDLGTNSVRFDVHELGTDRHSVLLHREKLMVRLGQGVFLGGKLDRAAVQRTLHAFQRFKLLAAHFRTQKIVAFGTSALREASDRERFLSLIRARTGIEVRVISGTDEAQLIALGILANESSIKRNAHFALVDIGGGSTEISICKGRESTHSHSFQLGTARLQQLYLRKSPPPADQVEELRRHIRNNLYTKILSERWPKVDRIIGSSGTIRALSKIFKKLLDKQIIQKAELSELIEQMCAMTYEELLKIPGMEPKRVDMILAGSILLEECMDVLGAKRVTATEYSLRDGILEEELQMAKDEEISHLSLHLPELYAKGQQFSGRSEKHLKQTVKMGEALFEKLRSLHGLERHWQVYLTAAIILRHAGESISPIRYEAHSYYIAKNADFSAMEKWESEFVAQLCLHHRGDKVDMKGVKDKKRRKAFLALLSFLRVVDVLDFRRDTPIAIRSFHVGARKVTARIPRRLMTGLEQNQVELRQKLFAKVFGKKFTIDAV